MFRVHRLSDVYIAFFISFSSLILIDCCHCPSALKRKPSEEEKPHSLVELCLPMSALLLEDATAHSGGMEKRGLFMRNLGTVEVGVMLCKVQIAANMHTHTHTHTQKSNEVQLHLKDRNSSLKWLSSGSLSNTDMSAEPVIQKSILLFLLLFLCVFVNVCFLSTVTSLGCLTSTSQNDTGLQVYIKKSLSEPEHCSFRLLGVHMEG